LRKIDWIMIGLVSWAIIPGVVWMLGAWVKSKLRKHAAPSIREQEECRLWSETH
jgi:hypothetical protein